MQKSFIARVGLVFVACFLFVGASVPALGASAAPSSVGTTTTAAPFNDRAVRQTCFANGQFLVFYGDGTNIVYATSTDGATWSTPVMVRANAVGYDLSIWCDGAHVYYSDATEAPGSPVVYRGGVLMSNGIIKWSAAEQIAVPGSGHAYGVPSVATDSLGYPFIGYRDFTTEKVYVTKSTMNDGTWVTAAGFPVAPDTKAVSHRIAMVPLTSGKMAAVWSVDLEAVRIRIWNGSAWSACCIHMFAGTHYAFFSAVAEGDNIHVVYAQKSSTSLYKIIYSEYLFATNSVRLPVTIQSKVGFDASPRISLNPSTGDLYVFWAGYPSANHIFYKKFTFSTGIWDAKPTDWINEPVNGLTNNAEIGSFYQTGGGFIGLAYLAGASSPYTVRFSYLVV